MMEDIGHFLGTVLRDIRTRRGMLLKEIAQILGYKLTYISDIERGERAIAQATLEVIDAYLKRIPLEDWEQYILADIRLLISRRWTAVNVLSLQVEVDEASNWFIGTEDSWKELESHDPVGNLTVFRFQLYLVGKIVDRLIRLGDPDIVLIRQMFNRLEQRLSTLIERLEQESTGSNSSQDSSLIPPDEA